MSGSLMEATCGSQPMQMSLTNKLERQKEDLTKRLEQVNNVIELLEKNPDTQVVLDAITKLGVY